MENLRHWSRIPFQTSFSSTALAPMSPKRSWFSWQVAWRSSQGLGSWCQNWRKTAALWNCSHCPPTLASTLLQLPPKKHRKSLIPWHFLWNRNWPKLFIQILSMCLLTLQTQIKLFIIIFSEYPKKSKEKIEKNNEIKCWPQYPGVVEDMQGSFPWNFQHQSFVQGSPHRLDPQGFHSHNSENYHQCH